MEMVWDRKVSLLHIRLRGVPLEVAAEAAAEDCYKHEQTANKQTEGGFPELKILKQRIRNVLQPDLSLGHSDKPSQSQTA